MPNLKRKVIFEKYNRDSELIEIFSNVFDGSIMFSWYKHPHITLFNKEGFSPVVDIDYYILQIDNKLNVYTLNLLGIHNYLPIHKFDIADMCQDGRANTIERIGNVIKKVLNLDITYSFNVAPIPFVPTDNSEIDIDERFKIAIQESKNLITQRQTYVQPKPKKEEVQPNLE